MTTQTKLRKYLVWVFALVACCLYIVSYYQPFWGFYLHSPQYNGLTLGIYFNKVGGDVREVDILNHYIGMGHLDQAAQFEKRISIYGIYGLAVMAILIAFLPAKKLAKYLVLSALLFPVVSVSILYYWMYHLGHHLNPKAPISVSAFTPVLLGAGHIGNFHTVGLPGAGFYLVMAAGACMVLIYRLRIYSYEEQQLKTATTHDRSHNDDRSNREQHSM